MSNLTQLSRDMAKRLTVRLFRQRPRLASSHACVVSTAASASTTSTTTSTTITNLHQEIVTVNHSLTHYTHTITQSHIIHHFNNIVHGTVVARTFFLSRLLRPPLLPRLESPLTRRFQIIHPQLSHSLFYSFTHSLTFRLYRPGRFHDRLPPFQLSLPSFRA